MTNDDLAADRPDLLEAVRGPLSPKRYWTAIVLSLVGIAVLLNLGFWQVDRLQWKNAVLSTIESRIHAAPTTLDELARMAAATGDVEYVPVTLTGRYLHEGERYFLSTSSGQAGWNVHTPLLVAGTGEAIFVNRGFVPYALRDPATRPQGQIEGEATVTGLARNALAEKPAGFTPDNDPAANAFFWRGLADMSQGLTLPDGVRLVPFTVDAGAGTAPGGYPVGGTTVVTVPNNHLQYAITWFALAATMAGMIAILVVTQTRRRRAAAG